MTKCPNCGSTAQVKIVSTEKIDKQEWLVLNCKCGCGCEFNANYCVNKPIVKRIITNKNERGNEK